MVLSYMSMENNVKEWVRLAKMDIAASHYLFDTFHPKPLEIICFHAQQAAEKMLKCYLITQNINPPRTHDMQVLCDMCIERNEGFNKIYESAVLLTRYGVIPRYPAEIAIIQDDAKKALLCGDMVVSFIETILSDYITTDNPNAETVAAMLEAEQIVRDPSIKRYSDVEEALRELKL